ncbi:MAG: hypothetical protein LKJ76_06040 [Lachnospiraceae bacterium]|nr:hypothetical protein [Lachnospiraceae bacterium]
MDLIYVCTGSHPDINELAIDANRVDLTNLAGKYTTSNFYRNNWFWLREINATTVNADVMGLLETIPQIPLYSMQYLVSAEYDHVISEHKLTLLLHVIDGLIDHSNSFRKSLKKEFINVYHLDAEPQNVGSYEAALNYLCKKYFFNYHRKFNCQILQLYRFSQRKFLDVMTDTRNWYSHLLPEDKKEDRLYKEDMQYFISLIVFALRIMILDQVGVSGDEEKIKNGYYVIHDWIVSNKHMEDRYPYKTGTYKLKQILEKGFD